MGPGKPDTAERFDTRRTAVAFWRANFVTSLAVVIALKLLLVAHHLMGIETVGGILGRSALLWGIDVLSAFFFASVLTLVALPALRARVRWLGWYAGGGRAVYAFLGVASLLCVVNEGGPLTRQTIDVAMVGQAGAVSEWLPMLRDSIVDQYLSPAALVVWLLVGGLSILGAGALERGWLRMAPTTQRVIVGALTLEVLLTTLLVPSLRAGTVPGLRMKTYGIEKSAWPELLGSYAAGFTDGASMVGLDPADPTRVNLASVVPAAQGTRNDLLGATARRTNILVILLESVGASYVDEQPSAMPFVAELAARPDTLSLSQHHATFSLTTKAVFSLLCSEQPMAQYRAVTVSNPTIPCRGLAMVLHDAGYYTAMISGQDLRFDRMRYYLRQQSFDLIWGAEDMPGQEDAWHASWGLDDRLTMRHVLEHASAKREQPFFILAQFYAGHHPYSANAVHEAAPLDREPGYRRALRFVDDRVRELMNGLGNSGVLDDTLVLILSDHGEGMGEHRGRNVYEELVHVPAILMGPQIDGGVVDLTTSHVDIAPTLLRLADVEPPCMMKGRALSQQAEPRLALFGGRPPRTQTGLKDGYYKYILEGEDHDMLFDIRDDPTERTNLSVQHAALTAQYRKRVQLYRAQAAYILDNYATLQRQGRCKGG